MKFFLVAFCIALLVFSGCSEKKADANQIPGVSASPAEKISKKVVSAGSLDIAGDNFIVLDKNDFN